MSADLEDSQHKETDVFDLCTLDRRRSCRRGQIQLWLLVAATRTALQRSTSLGVEVMEWSEEDESEALLLWLFCR